MLPRKQCDQVANSISVFKFQGQDTRRSLRRKAEKGKETRLWKQSLHIYGKLGGNCYTEHIFRKVRHEERRHKQRILTV